MAQVYLCIWYDTEDLLPESDDAALRIAQLHDLHRVPATFKVVGQKARLLQLRDRVDVISALSAFDIGYHTNHHSAHPVVTEYCEPLPWDHGEHLFRQVESPGLADVERIFGQRACTFGQAGAAWAPQMYPVLREWGIPTYVDDGPWIGLDEKPFWYMGLLHVFRLGRAPRFNPAEAGSELDAVARLHHQVKQLEPTGGVISVYFHPCEWTSDAFWDAVNFANGQNPPSRFRHDSGSQLHYLCRTTPHPEPAEVQRRYAALDTWLHGVEHAGAAAIGCSELPALYPDRALGGFYRAAELVEATGDWQDTVGFARVAQGWLCAAEVLLAAACLLAPCEGLVPAAAPRVGRAITADGPHTDGPALDGPVRVSADDMVSACGWLCEHCRVPGGTGTRAARHLPAGLQVGSVAVPLTSFLRGCLDLLRGSLVGGGELPDSIDLKPTHLAPADHVRGGPECFRWPIFPAGFDAPRTIDHARRQAWTLKPALLAPDRR